VLIARADKEGTMQRTEVIDGECPAEVSELKGPAHSADVPEHSSGSVIVGRKPDLLSELLLGQTPSVDLKTFDVGRPDCFGPKQQACY
jgi:hypothetical protein